MCVVHFWLITKLEVLGPFIRCEPTEVNTMSPVIYMLPNRIRECVIRTSVKTCFCQ